MKAGKLHTRLAILENTPTTDEFGHDVESWKSIGFAWCSLMLLKGRELVEAKQIREDVSHKIVTRYDPRITAKHRFETRYDSGITLKRRQELGSRVFELVSVDNVAERNRTLEIIATERPT